MIYKSPESGYLNIKANVNGTFSAYVNGDYLGTFVNLDKALDARDKNRRDRGLTELNDRSENGNKVLGIRWYAEKSVNCVRAFLGAFHKRIDAEKTCSEFHSINAATAAY